MRKTSFLLSAVASAGFLSAAPTISDVVVGAQADDGRVTITYSLSEAAIVTCELLLDGEPVPAEAQRTVTGAVNRKVAADTGLGIDWSPLAAGFTGVGELTARLTAWPLDNPPDYLAVDLTVANSRRYYATVDRIPGGLGADVNRRDILIMRRIPAADVVWRMGQPYPDGENCQMSNSAGSTKADLLNSETGHMVKLTNDYYMAVFETTQAQYWTLTRTNPSERTGAGNEHCPVDQVSYNTIVANLAVWRAFLGIASLDLPTEAEWEYACRAGTATAFNNGKNCNNPGNGMQDVNLREVASDSWSADLRYPVGLRQPNAWGLYDMHGNVAEICHDWFCGGEDYRATFAPGWETGAVTVAPRGPDNAGGTLANRVLRGGSSGKWYGPSWCRSAARASNYMPPSSANRYAGFRLICRIDIDK